MAACRVASAVISAKIVSPNGANLDVTMTVKRR
jgi:hypothetical protein